MERTVKEKRIQKKYEEDFKRQAVEMVIHSGKTQAQIARELGVSGYSLNLWKKTYFKRMEPAQRGEKVRVVNGELKPA
jgi:transposase-like protein